MESSGDAKLGTKGPSLARGFKDAVAYASAAWFPVSPEILKLIRSRTAEGAYEHDRSLLLADLRRDFALYAKVLRQVGEVAPEDLQRVEPTQLFSHTPWEKLRPILDQGPEAISQHRFEINDDYQAHRLRHCVLSTRTAELLAEKASVDPVSVYTCSLVRQMGFLTIAWNYPRTFAKAMAATIAMNNDLEAALFRYLGFSATLLGIKLTLDWSASHSLLIGLGYPGLQGSNTGKADLSEAPDEALDAGEDIANLCEVGEQFARVSDPKHYAVSARERERVEKQLVHYLGPKAMSLLRDRLVESSAAYQALSPKLFDIDATLRTMPYKGPSAYGLLKMSQNEALRKLPESVQERFRKAYDALEERKVSLDGVNYLINELIPELGFFRGCIYMVEPDGITVAPRLKIGDTSIEAYKTLRSSSKGPMSHPVLEALSCNVPLKQERVFLYGREVSHVTGVFGNREKTGVLYLEMSDRLLAEQEGHLPVLLFKAIRESLNAVLNLG